MTPSPDILAQQVDRLRLSEDERARLKTEVQKLDEKSLEEFSQLIKDHDLEAMQILDEKAEEEIASKDRLLQALPQEGQEQSSEAQITDLQEYLIGIFSDHEALAKFLAEADDVLIVKLAQFFDEVFAEDPERQTAIKNYFKEVRLQKMALKSDADAQEKAALEEAIEVKKQQISDLDAVIAEVETQLDNAEGKQG